MFLRGVIHGAALSALGVLLAFLLPYLTMDNDLLKIFAVLILVAPLLYIGYKFRGKIDMPVIEYIVYRNHKLWLYLMGAGLITALTSTMLKIHLNSIINFDPLTFVITYVSSLFGNTATMATIIFIGSSLNKKQ